MYACVLTDDNIFELAYHEQNRSTDLWKWFAKMTAFWFENLIRGKKPLITWNNRLHVMLRASPRGYDFQSHPMIKNYNFVRVNLININFFLWCHNKQMWPRRRNKNNLMSTNKRASTLFNVLLRFKCVKLQKFTLYVCVFFFGTNLPYFSACLWQFM